jgi:hypothetical protein
VRDLVHPRYQRSAILPGQTWPDLGEPLEFRDVSLYRLDPGASAPI